MKSQKKEITTLVLRFESLPEPEPWLYSFCGSQCSQFARILIAGNVPVLKFLNNFNSLLKSFKKIEYVYQAERELKNLDDLPEDLDPRETILACFNGEDIVDLHFPHF